MDKKELLNIIYQFYPRNIDVINYKPEYILSKEYKNLMDCVRRNQKLNKTRIKEYIHEIESIDYQNYSFLDITNFDWQDRCYNFEFKKQIDNNFLHLNLLKSIMAPIYTIKCSKVTFINNRYKYIDISNSDFADLNLISNIRRINNKYNLFYINTKLLNEKIPDINFQDIQMGEFTFFNAFFN